MAKDSILKKRKWSKASQLQEDISPNLIPMIDIMFLLLLFLMLGADMGQREFEDVILPVVDSTTVQEKPDRDPAGMTIINVYHRDTPCTFHKEGGICSDETHWSIGVRGNDYTPTSIGALIKSEADLGRADPKKPEGLSERTVMIRADQSALYKYVQKVIEACAYAGLYKIEIGAAAKV